MKHTNKLVFFLFCALGTAYLCAEVAPYIAPRSESAQAARELVGTRDHVNRYDVGSFYGTFSIMPGYDCTFKEDRIAETLFCDALSSGSTSTVSACCNRECCKNITVSGMFSYGTSQAERKNRSNQDLLADYFGLPMDFKSAVFFAPKVANMFMDFNAYFGFDKWLEGLYFRIHAPFVHTRWELGFCEKVAASGTLNHPSGYFNDDLTMAVIANNPYGVLRKNLLKNFEDYAINEKAPLLLGTTSGTATVKFEPLRHAKMYKCTKSDNKLSDVQMALGWNFWQDEDYHFGLQIRASAPSGTRPEATYLFEPIVGNGHHWELGAGLTSHWTAWRSDDEVDAFAMYLDANITHLFKTRQCRTFDLCCKPLSRYMLAQKMKTTDVTVYKDALHTQQANAQFDNLFTPVANLTTMNVNVSADVAGNVALLFAWNHHNWGIDFGYEFFGRSSEKICKRCCTDSCCTTTSAAFAENTWALKGDAYVYGFQTGASLTAPTALSATESLATVFKGTNQDEALPHTNSKVDNPADAYAEVGQLFTVGHTTAAAAVQGSFPAIFIKESDIDMSGTRIISHKVFAHVAYNWKDHDFWVPYIGIGGEAEFGHRDGKCCPTGCNPVVCTTACNTCTTNTSCCCDSKDNACCDENKCIEGRDVAMWRWGIWLKGGVSFD